METYEEVCKCVYDKAIDDVISMLNNMKLDIYSKEILSAVNATISLIVADVKQGFLLFRVVESQGTLKPRQPLNK